MTALAFVPNGVQKSSLSNMIEEWFNNDVNSRKDYGMPSTNILEDNDKYIIELSVPGYTRDLLSINVNRNQLPLLKNRQASSTQRQCTVKSVKRQVKSIKRQCPVKSVKRQVKNVKRPVKNVTVQ